MRLRLLRAARRARPAIGEHRRILLGRRDGADDGVEYLRVRDGYHAAIGLEASLTGHLVFSTLHPNSAPETITRLLDMNIDPFNFADALLGIMAQRLIRTLCKCKEGYHPSEEEWD